MIGPVMIGPSSSHTAGVVRIARAAVKLLGARQTKQRLLFITPLPGRMKVTAVIARLLQDCSTSKPMTKELRIP